MKQRQQSGAEHGQSHLAQLPLPALAFGSSGHCDSSDSLNKQVMPFERKETESKTTDDLERHRLEHELSTPLDIKTHLQGQADAAAPARDVSVMAVSGTEANTIAAALGPALPFLPKTVAPEELQAYRIDYQAFRAGQAAGAHGEIGHLRQAPWGRVERKAYEPVIKRRHTMAMHRAPGHPVGRKDVRLVPLIGLSLGSSSAAQSAQTAADEWHQQPDKKGPSRRGSKMNEKLLAPASSRPGLVQRLRQRSNWPTSWVRQFSELSTMAAAATAGVAGAVDQGIFGPLADDGLISRDDAPSPPVWEQRKGQREEKDMPWSRGSARQGVGLQVHIMVSLASLAPSLLLEEPTWLECLLLPICYCAFIVFLVFCHALCKNSSAPSPSFTPVFRKHARRRRCCSLCRGYRHGSWEARIGNLLTQVLKMERVVREGCVPRWFPRFCAIKYSIVAVLLAAGRALYIQENAKKVSLWSATPQRHDYSCWGTHEQDVADCILVRHSACTMLVALYACLLALAACNRSVTGVAIAQQHRQSLEDMFPHEAPSLFSYVDKSVNGNEACWRKSRSYKARMVLLSLVWTFISFVVYGGLLQEAKTMAQWVFFVAVPFTWLMQYSLLQHVLLHVILHLEAVKARAAALAYCDEEGILPFTSAHAIYVWFSVRRNVQAWNEVAYQHTSPVLAASLLLAFFSSCWVVSKLSKKDEGLFSLTSQGGASLVVVGVAVISCLYVFVFLRTLLDIGRLEEAHIRQLRIAHLRLEHERLWVNKTRQFQFETGLLQHKEVRTERSCERSCDSEGSCDEEAGTLSCRRPLELRRSRVGSCDSLVAFAETEEALAGAVAMIDKVIALLENHDAQATIFGIEIGSKSFKVVYAALLSNGWYLLVWGVLIPLISFTPSTESSDGN
eukprot:TRINITY_DN39429_c0_g1_i1.p1 TRINITY_DN39429_c0_g1~~TRINITY_DN39429_c0_g1_i1.p1  ORF type:complete len:900 (+),score=199.90 TRINITY_DN39429_c0_g1_i1:134-2833(+)